MWIRLSILLLAGLVADAQVPSPDQRTRQIEADLGARLAYEVRQSGELFGSEAALSYAEQIGGRLAVYLPEGAPGNTFEVIVEPGGSLHEPIALPGGYVFIRAGLFLAAQNASEFAGMLAHSMAHAATLEGTRLLGSGQVINRATIVFGEHTMTPLGMRPFMQRYELRADQIAVRTLSQAGYDPAALARYVDRMQTDNVPLEFSSLPPREERLAALRQAIADLPPGDYTTDTGEFEVVRDEVRTFMERLHPAPSLR